MDGNSRLLTSLVCRKRAVWHLLPLYYTYSLLHKLRLPLSRPSFVFRACFRCTLVVLHARSHLLLCIVPFVWHLHPLSMRAPTVIFTIRTTNHAEQHLDSLLVTHSLRCYLAFMSVAVLLLYCVVCISSYSALDIEFPVS